jgi:hypothetical protein
MSGKKQRRSNGEVAYTSGYESGYGIGYGDALYDIEQAAYTCREARGHLAPDIEGGIPALDEHPRGCSCTGEDDSEPRRCGCGCGRGEDE